MTHREIHIAFKMVLDKNAASVSFGGAPAFLSEEINYFLNQAKDEITSNKFTGINTRGIPFEGDNKRTADLQSLVKQYTNKIEVIEAGFNMWKTVLDIDIIKDVLAPITLHLIYTKSDDTKVRKICKLITHDQAQKFYETDINKPWIPHPVAYFEGNNLYFLIDDSLTDEPTWCYFEYLKIPSKIDYTLGNNEYIDLNDNVLREIIDRAVVLALENIESQRTSSKLQLNNISE